MSPPRNRRTLPRAARVAALAGLLALSLPPREALAVVPGLAPVGFAILPQILAIAGALLLFLARPRTWIRAISFAARRPMRALAVVLPFAGAIGIAILLASEPKEADPGPSKPPAPPSALFGPPGGPNQSFASDFRGAGVHGPNLQPEIRWVRGLPGTFSILAAAGRLVVRDRAILAARDLKTGEAAWTVALDRSDGFDPILLGSSGPILAPDGRLLDPRTGRSRGSVAGVRESRAAVFRDGFLVVLGERGLLLFDAREARTGRVARTARVPCPVRAEDARMAIDESSRLFVAGGPEIAGLDLARAGSIFWRRRLWGPAGPPTCAGGWVYALVRREAGEADGIVRLDPEEAGEKEAGEPPTAIHAQGSRLAAGKNRIAIPVSLPGRAGPFGSPGSSPRARAGMALLDVQAGTLVRTIPLGASPVQPIVASDAAAYVAEADGRIERVSFEAQSVTWRADLGTLPTGPMILCDGLLLVPAGDRVAVLED